MSLVGPLGKGKKTFNIVRRVNVDEATLKTIARALGIPPGEHDRIESISGDIVISPAPSTGGGGAAAQGGGAQGTSGGRSPSTGSGGTGS